jgi:hypothetical protein
MYRLPSFIYIYNDPIYIKQSVCLYPLLYKKLLKLEAWNFALSLRTNDMDHGL